VDEIIISPNLIHKPPPLHKMSEVYCAGLKQWIGEWFTDEIVTDSNKENHLKKNSGLDPGPVSKRIL